MAFFQLLFQFFCRLAWVATTVSVDSPFSREDRRRAFVQFCLLSFFFLFLFFRTNQWHWLLLFSNYLFGLILSVRASLFRSALANGHSIACQIAGHNVSMCPAQQIFPIGIMDTYVSTFSAYHQLAPHNFQSMRKDGPSYSWRAFSVFFSCSVSLATCSFARFSSSSCKDWTLVCSPSDDGNSRRPGMACISSNCSRSISTSAGNSRFRRSASCCTDFNRCSSASLLSLHPAVDGSIRFAPLPFQLYQAGNQFNGRNQLGISGISFKPGLQGGLLLHQQTYILLCLTNGLTDYL